MNLIHTIDEQVYNNIIKLMSGNMNIVMTMISHLGSAITFIILTIAIIIIIKDKKDAKLIALNLIIVFIINRVLKFIIARPRPQVFSIVNETRL